MPEPEPAGLQEGHGRRHDASGRETLEGPAGDQEGEGEGPGGGHEQSRAEDVEADAGESDLHPTDAVEARPDPG